jgi:autotransporter-associated beta strand protein
LCYIPHVSKFRYQFISFVIGKSDGERFYAKGGQRSMSKRLNFSSALGVALAGLLFSSTPSAMAVNYMWNNTGATWNSGTSWVGGVAPASNSSSIPDTVQFGSMTPDFNNVYLGSNRTVAGATFDAGANAYTFTTDAVTPLRLAIGTSGISNNSSATQTFNLGVDVTQATSTWQSVAGGSLIFNNGIGLSTSATSRTLTVAGAGNFTVNQAIVNGGTATAGVVTVTATGVTTFSGNNTYDGRTTMNAAGGTLTLSGDNSGAAGGVTLTAGTLNINNNNALGSGALTLAGAGATINNTSGSAVVNVGNQAWTWENGLAFGATGNTAANNLNLGTGVVTASSSRTIALEGTGTKLTMGAVNITSTAASRSITANGVGNTLEMGGLTLSASLTPTTVTLAGTANIGVTGAIVNGTTPGNGLTVTATGTTTLSGNNTYTGLTTMNAAGGTLVLSGNNSAASGGVTLTAGTLNINNNNALGSGALTLTSGTINNTSGGAIANAENNTVTWGGDFTFGTAGSTSLSNLNLGTGTVTASTSRGVTFAGTGTKLTIGAVNITSTSSGRTITANGAGNTLEMGGLTLSASATPVTVTLAGTANIGVTGAIVNGTTPGNGLTVTATGTTTLSGNNTYTGVTTMNAAGGTLILSGNNSSATGGTTLTTGTLNINNANALSTGLLELSAVTSTAYGSSIINNTSGGALTFSGLSGVRWSGVSPAGIQFGTSASTSANNMDFGTGLVTAGTDRSMNIAGTGVTISMGTLTTSGTAASYTYKIDGAGNTLDLDGWRISGAASPTQAAQHKISGTANVNIGTIENGTGSFANGVGFNNDGVTRLTGNNTYTGATEFTGSGTNIISGNNSAAVGNVTIAGTSGSGKMPVVRLDNINAISSSSSLLGASGNAQIGTLDLRAAGDFSLNSFGVAGVAGNNMIFMNSSGSQKTLAFTAANNYITTASTGGRTLNNNSANLLLDFDGNIEIGGSSSAAEATTFAGVGNFNVDGNLLDTGTGVSRALRKQGDGTLTLRGSANNIRGSTLVETGTLDLYGNLTASTDIVVSTSVTSANAGARTANATINVRSGGSLLNSSTTTVWSRGDLIVNGTAGAVVVKDNGLLGGSGSVGAITGAGTVGPGNSPGILTAVSVNPTEGTDFKFEFTSLNPTYTSATASGNDLLHLTASSSPFAGGLFTSGNIVSIYLNSATITASLLAGTNTTFSGGFFVDGTYALSSALTPASFAYYTTSAALGTGSAVDYNGTNYYLLNSTIAAKTTLSDTAVTSAGFATGTVSGTLLTFNAVPEPSTGSMLGLGLAGLVVTRLLRRKSS